MKLQGCSYKEIANTHQLSPRTVETYLNRIKTRSGISQKAQLQELINFCK
jgi:DNA-binding CsgD family transcriptional regulator